MFLMSFYPNNWGVQTQEREALQSILTTLDGGKKYPLRKKDSNSVRFSLK